MISRRHFLATGSLAAAAVALRPRTLFAQETLAPILVQFRKAGIDAKIQTQALRGKVSALIGSGGNIAVLTGADGKVIIDSGMSTSKPQISEALAGLSGDPVKHLINTHWHFDHTDGNEWMHGAGAAIMAHENTKKRLSTPQTMEIVQATFPAAPAGAIPTETFTEKKTLHLNGEELHLVHYAPAHTDTDIYIYFEKADVLHIADTWFNGNYPLIDYSSGGNINGMIAAADRSLKVAGAKTIIIPGHGNVGDKEQLTKYRDMLVDCRDSVAALKKQGKTKDEVVAAKPTAKYDAAWGGGLINPAAFTGLVYQGV